MAGAEDFGPFESNFLDSMLEVEMTEEEGEVKISQNDDHFPANEREFPPIPRFDLQSETMTYKNPYGNSHLPVKQTSILKSNAQMPGSSYPIIQPSPMIVIHSNMLKGNNVTIKPSTAGIAPPGVSGKQTPVAKSIIAKPARATELAPKIASNLVAEVFKPEFVRKVYTNKEDLPDVSVIGEEEEAFYKFAFQDVSKVQMCRLHCTICDKHIGCGKGVEKKISVHSMLKVLTCKVCSEFYGDGNFPCDEGDHCEIYCRWCGQGGALICCSFCPKVFCKRCVRRNYTQAYVRAVEKASDWACFVCAQKPLWPHRAVCRALMEYMKLKKADIKLPAKDTSTCCKQQMINKKIVSEVDRNKIFLSGGQTLQIKPKETGNTPQSLVKAPAPATITRAPNSNGPMIVKNFSTALKVNSQTKAPVAVINKPNIMAIAPKTATTSSLGRATLPRPVNPVTAAKAINSVPPQKPISGVNIPRIINTPIYHGQTLITPPKNSSVQKKAPVVQNKETPPESAVKVSVTDCVNVDINKIPVAMIPPYVQGVILRLNFPDNKVQLVRLIREGDPNEENAIYPIPKFENGDNLDFLESSLEDSFKLTRMLYERLMKIKEKLNTKNKYTKDSIYRSSVEKLSFIYEKSRELMKELDENLLSNYEIWKEEKEKDNNVSIIDLTDDEGNPPEKINDSTITEKAKMFPQEEDSDIEVVNAVAKRGILNPQRILRSSLKRDGDPKPFGNQTPEHVDVNAFDGKRKKNAVGKAKKRMKLSEDEEVMEVTEKDPLAVSDTELEPNSHATNGLGESVKEDN